MSLLKTKVLPRLNGEYETKIKSFEEIENTQGGYIKVILELPDRDYTYCIFPSQVDYVASCLKAQFDIEEETTLGEVLEEATKQTFKVWFSYNEEYNRMNVNLHQRNVVTEEAPDL
jgi:hypothetical protein